MVYQGHYKEFAGLPGLSQVNFQQDYPAFLKITLAPKSSEERIHTLIADLAGKKVLTLKDYYEMQLAADEGVPASRAAAVQLQQMNGNKDKYTVAGFIALLQVLRGVGDSQQSPIFAQFMSFANVEFMYVDILRGVPRQIVPGY